MFDGEGSFGIWSKVKTKKYFACSVEMTDKDMVKRFHDFFGGAFYLCKRRKEGIDTAVYTYIHTYKWGSPAYEPAKGGHPHINILKGRHPHIKKGGTRI